MKKLLLLILLFPLAAFASNPARFDLPVLTTTPAVTPIGSLPTLLAVTNATIAVCGYPATLVNGMCTNTIATYTDSTLSTACPSTAQLTAPGTSVCISTTGLQGTFGFWFNAATQTHMTYTVQSTWGTFGPYDIDPGSVSGGGNGTVTDYTSGNLSPLFTTSVANGSTTPAQSFTASAFGAHTFYGNNGASTATPGANLIGASDWSPNAYVAGSGSAQAQTVTLSPAATALTPGLEVWWLPVAANTATAPTLNVNGLGARLLTKLGTTGLAVGDLTTSAIADAIYDGSRWQLQNPQTASASSFPSGTTNQLLYYPSPGTTVAPLTLGSNLSISGSTLNATGGGGSLPSANAGQILSNTTGSSTYAGQANIFYQQSADTVASIEAACSSACTYIVTSPQTFTLAANHTLSSNVWVKFEANGSWAVNGSGFTLSGVQVVTSSTKTQHFVAGSGSLTLGYYNSDVPVEWFGAIGDWNGTTGTDDTTAIQACFNAIQAGQCVLQPLTYKTTAALTIYKGNVGLRGVKTGRGLPSEIISTSATADILDVGNGTLQGWNNFNNFTLARSAAPTGTTDAGLSLNNAAGVVIDNVNSQDSHRDFYYHEAPAFGVGVTSNSSAGFTFSGETSGSWYGYYLDSADGNSESSLRFLNSTASNNTGQTSQTTYGMILIGEALNDVMTYGFETAGVSYGQAVDYTGSGGSFATNDIHFTKSIHDGCLVSCYLIENTSLATDGFVEIAGGHVNSTVSTSPLIDIESSYGVTVRGVNINQHNGFTASHAIYAASSAGLVIANNVITNFGTSTTTQSPVEFTAVTHSAITGNQIYADSSNAGNIIWLTGSSTYNSVTGNALSGYSTAGNGIAVDTGSNFNNCCAANAVDTTHVFGAAVADTGTGNGMLSPLNVAGTVSAIPTKAVVGFNADMTGEPGGTVTQYPAFKATGPQDFTGWNNGTPNDAFSLGFTIPNGTAGTVPLFAVYGGSSWKTAWSVDPSSLAMSFFGSGSLIQTSAATSSANVNSPGMSWTGNYWTGTASATDTWTCYDNLSVWTGSPTNSGSRLECDHAGSSGGGVFYTPSIQTLNANITNVSMFSGALLLSGSTVAGPSNNYPSSTATWQDNYWDGSNHQTSTWVLTAVNGTGANPTQTLQLTRAGAGTGAQLIDFSAEPIKLGSVYSSIVNVQGSPGNLANSANLSFGSGTAFLDGYGTNSSTQGSVAFRSVSSNASLVTTDLTLTPTLATFNEDVTVHGTAIATGNLVAEGNVQIGSAGAVNSGTTAPSGSCGIGDLYTNTGATSASTVLYVCYPSNTWTAVTVP